ncbi:MAG: hypothetical protein H7062_22315 [Candidatus Saccharimonas sp.]|nr:hypothetical protein [Planctomycetaceae bacterium]
MTNQTVEDIKKLLADALKETGVQFKTGVAEVAVFTHERAAHLATLVTDPNFQIAVRAERNAVWLKASSSAVSSADAMEARMLGIIQGALAITARILVV